MEEEIYDDNFKFQSYTMNDFFSVNGGWGAWCAWSSCSESCGGGSKSRSRKCDNPAPYYGGLQCYGNSQETKSCNTEYCSGEYSWIHTTVTTGSIVP